jgi:predicted amidohydrolase
MRIGIAQTDPAFGEVDRNIAEALVLIGKERADLWILPELFATGYQFVDANEARKLSEPVPDGPTTRALIDHAKVHGCHVVAGLPESASERIYNAAVLVGPGGFLACYRKVHLFCTEKEHFAPGDRSFPVTDVGIARIGTIVCFDHLFPESARSLALQGADVIAHPANLVLPDLAQRTMAIRALENRVFTATANRVGEESRTGETLVYTGRSQVVGPDGAILVRLSPDRTEIGVVEIDVERARDKRITSYNNVLADRRPDQYRL